MNEIDYCRSMNEMDCGLIIEVWTAYRNSWTLDARGGRWTLDFRSWALDAGSWTLDAGRCT